MNPAMYATRFPGLGNRSAASWEALGLADRIQKLEATDFDNAERAGRMKTLFESPVWRQDVLPTLQAVYDQAFTEVKQKSLSVDAVVVLDRLLEALQMSMSGGFESMQRIVNRRMTSSDSSLPPLGPAE